MEADQEQVSVVLARERNTLALERTRLAAERTLSAWIRTGLASLGGGFAILRLLVFENVTHRFLANVVGELLIIWGINIFIFSLLRHKRATKLLGGVSSISNIWFTVTMIVFIIVSLCLFVITVL